MVANNLFHVVVVELGEDGAYGIIGGIGMKDELFLVVRVGADTVSGKGGFEGVEGRLAGVSPNEGDTFTGEGL
jgi:hypothetical protein